MRANTTGLRRLHVLTRVIALSLVAGLLAPLCAPGLAIAAPKPKITSISVTPTVASRYVAPKKVVVKFKLNTKAKVTLKIANSSGSGKTLLSAKSLSAGTRSAAWNLKTKSGSWAPDGRYTVTIQAQGSAGKSPVYKKYVTLDTKAPYAYLITVVPPTISPKIDEVAKITYRTTDNNSALPVVATLRVISEAGGVVRSIVATAALPGSGRQFVFDGKPGGGGSFSPGRYKLRIDVQDAAGNKRSSAIKPFHINWFGAERPIDLTPYSDGVVRTDVVSGITHVVWNNSDTPSLGVRYRRLDEYGNTTVGPLVIDAMKLTMTSRNNGYPDVGGAPDGGAFITWRGVGPTTSKKSIWLAYIDPAGRKKWSKPIIDEPSGSTAQTLDPRISVGPNGIAHIVCWRELQPNAIYYVAYRKDGMCAAGLGTLAAGNVSNERRYPNVECDASGRVHVMWFDAVDHPGNPSRRELYYTKLGFLGGYVAPPGTGSIFNRRETNTTYGFSPDASYPTSPEMAVGSDGRLHVTWPDQQSAKSSNGILYRRLAPNGTPEVASLKVFDGSSTSTFGRYGWQPTIAALAGTNAQVVFTALEGLTGIERLWSARIDVAGRAQEPYLITDGSWSDVLGCIDSGSDGTPRLLYMGDTNVRRRGVVVQRLTYKDMHVDEAANDTDRPDLEVDGSNWAATSTRTPPRQNSPVTVKIDVMNAGWKAGAACSAVLEYEGDVVDTAIVPALDPEEVTRLTFDWTIPSDAEETPADLAVRILPAAGMEQTSEANDVAEVPLEFLLPPTTVNLYAKVYDETYDTAHTYSTPVVAGTATLTGTTKAGAPLSLTGTPYNHFKEFLNVPMGEYTMAHSAPGYVSSPPASVHVSVQADPSDNYKILISPAWVANFWVNTWGSIAGQVVEQGTTTPVIGANVRIVGSDASSDTAAPQGTFNFEKMAEGSYTLRVTRADYRRVDWPQAVLKSTVHNIEIPMQPTTKGYLVGSITDEGGYPAANDPDSTSDDPRLIIRQGTTVKYNQTLHDGHFDIELDEGNYTAEYQAPGFITQSGIAIRIDAGLETDGSRALDLDVSNMKHEDAAERWGVAWTMAANFGGSQPPKSPVPSYNIKKWNGLFRFDASCDHQKVGLSEYIRQVSTSFLGEMFEWHYFYGVSPPEAPAMFKYGFKWPWQELKYEPPMLSTGTLWNRTGVRVDGVDVVDQRSWETVASIRSQWYSAADWVGHRYGDANGSASGDLGGDGVFSYSATPPPWNQQVVRFWITIGQLDEDSGQFKNAPFADYSGLNFGDMMNATGYQRLQLLYRPVDDYVWVEPAYTGYPESP